MPLQAKVRRSAAVFLLASVALSTSPAALAALRANYEVSLSDDGKVYSIRTAENLDSDRPLVQELGPFTVALLPVFEDSGAYSLQVTVTRKPSSPDAVALPITRSFPGSMGGPLEFTAQFGEAQASGAVVLYEQAGSD